MAYRARVLAICLVFSVPVAEGCGALFGPSHGSITGTWERRYPSEDTAGTLPDLWTLRVTESSGGSVTGTITRQLYIDPTPPPGVGPPPLVWLVKGSRRGSKVELAFTQNGTVQQYFEGKQVAENIIEGFISPEEGSEHRVMVEFVRR